MTFGGSEDIQFTYLAKQAAASAPPTVNRYDAWEVGYNHYHHRKRIALPNTERLIEEQIREKAPRAVCNLVFDMLTHSGLPKVPNKSVAPKVKECAP